MAHVFLGGIGKLAAASEALSLMGEFLKERLAGGQTRWQRESSQWPTRIKDDFDRRCTKRRKEKEIISKKDALSRIVGVEEHVTFPELTAQLSAEAAAERGYLSQDRPFGDFSLNDPMKDTDGRIQTLGQAGITMQVLSFPYAGADLLAPSEGRRWASEINNRIAERVAEHPDRYAAFAHLPLTDPEAAADELERTVSQLGFKGALVSGETRGCGADRNRPYIRTEILNPNKRRSLQE